MKFQVKTYEGVSSKIKSSSQELSLVLLADLHQQIFGKRNDVLLDKVSACRPDAILIPGDMVVGKKGCTTQVAEETILSLAEIAPVYYANGNHETRMKKQKKRYGSLYERYRSKLKAGGIHFLENETAHMCIKGVPCRIYGLELSLSFYERFRKIRLEHEEIVARIGEPDPDCFNILLAHHPRYGDSYFQWGADLTVSGHIHGGVMRLGKRAVLSPDGRIFPKYGYGWFEKEGSYMAVSSGLGEHSIPFRILNPREIVQIVIKQEVPNGDTCKTTGI